MTHAPRRAQMDRNQLTGRDARPVEIMTKDAGSDLPGCGDRPDITT
jgi:hypothetical protein